MTRTLTPLALLLGLEIALLARLLAAPAIVSSALEAPADLVRILRLQLRAPAPLAVEYWTDDGPRLRVDAPAAADHAITLARLRPARTYHYRVAATRATGSFRTDPLPADLAALSFAVTGTPTSPLALVHLFDEKGFKGYVVLDAGGEVVWYWRSDDFPFGCARLSTGEFVFMDKGRGIVVVTPAGEVVRELPQEDAEHELHHDLVVTPADTVLYLAFDTEEVDGKRVKGEAIWEWTPATGRLAKRWRSWDHLSPTLDRGPRFATEWMHANSLALGPRGNVLVSAHYFNQVLSLTADWRGIEWRLGGPRATIVVADEEQFSGQHTAHEVAPGRVLLFDNRRDRADYSRVVEFTLAGGEATKAWEWKPARANYASAVSSARRLANGNTLAAFGMSQGQSGATGPTEAYEVTPAGAIVWHLQVSGTTTMYRVEPLASIAGER